MLILKKRCSHLKIICILQNVHILKKKTSQNEKENRKPKKPENQINRKTVSEKQKEKPA
jgi:hypothetical protein